MPPLMDNTSPTPPTADTYKYRVLWRCVHGKNNFCAADCALRKSNQATSPMFVVVLYDRVALSQTTGGSGNNGYYRERCSCADDHLLKLVYCEQPHTIVLYSLCYPSLEVYTTATISKHNCSSSYFSNTLTFTAVVLPDVLWHNSSTLPALQTHMEVTCSSSLGVQSVLEISKYGTETSKDSTKYVIHGGWQNGCSATIEGDGIGWRAGSAVFLNLAAQRALVMASKTKCLSSPIKCDCPPAYLS